ncbi:MAG: carnitine dehydratase [Catenulispora sp.]|nr:carnitine dehydratase [Catenulispora sp.]
MDDLVLPSIFRVADFATWTVAAAHTQAAAFLTARNGAGTTPQVSITPREAAIAFRSERYLRLNGEPTFDWAPLSGDYQTTDGWIRLHCNFDHHAAIACQVLGVPQDRSALEAAVRRRNRFELEDAITEAGGVAAAMRSRTEWAAHEQSQALAKQPLVALTPIAGGETFAAICAATNSDRARPASRNHNTNTNTNHLPRPLSGIRVLDLTRIIAGPNAGRVLAAYGADVTMIRSPLLPTIRGLDLDLNFGKSLRFLDLRSAAGHSTFLDLVRSADIVLQSYRPGALAALGLGPSDLAALNPRLIYASISAYGTTGPWAARRGFDSLVQMAVGIADEGMQASSAPRPVPLPAQVLDHAAGWLTAAGAIEALNRGGGLTVDVSLAGVSAALDRLGRWDPSIGLAVPDPALSDVEGLLLHTPTSAGTLTHVRFPGRIPGAEIGWSGPPPIV